MAEEDDAVAELGGDTEEAAMGQAANTPNKRVISINIKEPRQCAGGNVGIKGNLVVTFKHTRPGVVIPTSVKLARWRTCTASGQQSLKPFGVGAVSQRLIPMGERSGLQTPIATTESVLPCVRMKS
jgi:hypothetical protein